MGRVPRAAARRRLGGAQDAAARPRIPTRSGVPPCSRRASPASSPPRAGGTARSSAWPRRSGRAARRVPWCPSCSSRL